MMACVWGINFHQKVPVPLGKKSMVVIPVGVSHYQVEGLRRRPDVNKAKKHPKLRKKTLPKDSLERGLKSWPDITTTTTKQSLKAIYNTYI